MLTIRRKYTIVLAIVFGLAMISFNLVMNKFFYQSFKEYISTDMKQNYEVSAKNLDDYIVINNMNKNDLIIEDLNDKAMRFIVERVYCQGVLFSLDGNVVATGVTNEKEIDLNLLKDLPMSFDISKGNKTMLDIESRDGRVFGKLSYSIYGKDNTPIGVLVLIKDYSDELLRNTSTKNLINLIVGILFALIFISVYYLSSTMVKPIIMLKDKVSEISKGKYPDKLEVKSKDEIGVLVNSFNLMSEKLRIKDEQEKNIFRNITHELKTPLTSISGYAQILRDDNFDNEEFRKKALNRIVSESDRMHDLVVTLLDISKQSSELEEYYFEEINLKSIIEEVLLVQLPKINVKSLDIITKYSDLTVKGNKQYLRMLLGNLIENGVNYSNNNSEILINLKEDSEYVVFSILTEGKVIPLEMREKIFEPFIKVETEGFSSKTSHGLGLYICKNIVLGHNGFIDVNLDNNKSEFVVKIPLFNTLETSAH